MLLNYKFVNYEKLYVMQHAKSRLLLLKSDSCFIIIFEQECVFSFHLDLIYFFTFLNNTNPKLCINVKMLLYLATAKSLK